MFAVCCLLFVVCCSLVFVDVCCLLLVVCSWVVVRCLPLSAGFYLLFVVVD